MKRLAVPHMNGTTLVELSDERYIEWWKAFLVSYEAAFYTIAGDLHTGVCKIVGGQTAHHNVIAGHIADRMADDYAAFSRILVEHEKKYGRMAS